MWNLMKEHLNKSYESAFWPINARPAFLLHLKNLCALLDFLFSWRTTAFPPSLPRNVHVKCCVRSVFWVVLVLVWLSWGRPGETWSAGWSRTGECGESERYVMYGWPVCGALVLFFRLLSPYSSCSCSSNCSSSPWGVCRWAALLGSYTSLLFLGLHSVLSWSPSHSVNATSDYMDMWHASQKSTLLTGLCLFWTIQSESGHWDVHISLGWKNLRPVWRSSGWKGIPCWDLAGGTPETGVEKWVVQHAALLMLPLIDWLI